GVFVEPRPQVVGGHAAGLLVGCVEQRVDQPVGSGDGVGGDEVAHGGHGRCPVVVGVGGVELRGDAAEAAGFAGVDAAEGAVPVVGGRLVGGGFGAAGVHPVGEGELEEGVEGGGGGVGGVVDGELNVSGLGGDWLDCWWCVVVLWLEACSAATWVRW